MLIAGGLAPLSIHARGSVGSDLLGLDRHAQERRRQADSSNQVIGEKTKAFQTAFEKFIQEGGKYPSQESKALKQAQTQARVNEMKLEKRIRAEETKNTPEALTAIIQSYHPERLPEGFSKRPALNPTKDLQAPPDQVSSFGYSSVDNSDPEIPKTPYEGISEAQNSGRSDPSQGLDPNHFPKELNFPKPTYDLWKGIKRDKSK